MAGLGSGWWLGVDLGAMCVRSAWVAGDSGSRVNPVVAGPAQLSAVFLASAGRIEVGEAAAGFGVDNPTRYIPSPKTLIVAGHRSVTVDGTVVAVSGLVAALLRPVLMSAVRQHGGQPPAELVLTHPGEWVDGQIQTLRAAATELGLGDRVRTVAEEFAAAQYYLPGAPVGPGAFVAVVDFGASALRVAMVRPMAAGAFTVLAAQSDPDVSSARIDVALRRWAETELAGRNPELLGVFGRSPAAARTLDRAIRTAKEDLMASATATVDVEFAEYREKLSLTRADLDGLIAPELARSVRLFESVLRSTRLDEFPAMLYPAGGSARIPGFLTALERFGRPAQSEAPENAVVFGSLMSPGMPGYAAVSQVSTTSPTDLTPLPPMPSPPRTRPPIPVVQAPSPVDAARTAVEPDAWAEEPNYPRRRRRVWMLAALAGAVLAIVLVVARQPHHPTAPGTAADVPAVRARIAIGGRPSTMALDNRHGKLYVADDKSTVLREVNLSTQTTSTVITLDDPISGVSYDDQTHMIYVATNSQTPGGSGKVSLIDATTDAVMTTIPLSCVLGDIKEDIYNNMVYAVCAKGFAVIDTLTKAIAGSVPVGAVPHSVAIAADGLYVTTGLPSGAVAVVGVMTNTIGDSVAMRHPANLIAAGWNSTAYVTNGAVDGQSGDTLSTLDLRANTVKSTAALPDVATGLADMPGIHTAFVLSGTTTGQILLVDTDDGKIRGTIPTGGRPTAVTTNQDSQRAYVLDSSGTVTVLGW